MGLAILFNAYVSAELWVDAFTYVVFIINPLPSKLLDNKSMFELLFFTSPNYDLF